MKLDNLYMISNGFTKNQTALHYHSIKYWWCPVKLWNNHVPEIPMSKYKCRATRLVAQI